MKLPTVLLADDHAIILDGLDALLEGHARVLGRYPDGESLLAATDKLHPDVVVTDISMPKLSGLDYLRAVKQQRMTPRVIVLSMHSTEATVAAALRSGAMGYVPKHAAGEELLDAMRRVLDGGTYVSPLVGRAADRSTPAHGSVAAAQLTRRQYEVLRLIASGKRMKEIAAELQLSPRTVEMHKYAMMRTLGLRTTADLIKYYMSSSSTPPAAASEK